MEAVTTHGLRLIKLVRQTVEIGVSRQRMMKRRVEYRDVRDSGKQPAHFANACNVHRVVQRREWTERLDFREHLVGDERAFGEFLTTVNNAMRNDADFSCARNDSGFLCREFAYHGFEGVREI